MIARFGLSSLLVLCIGILNLLAQPGRPLTIEDALQLPYPRTFDVSPDGNRFVFTIHLPDFQESRWQTQIWIQDGMDQPPRRLTYWVGNEYAPRWSPDGRWITFLTARPYRNHQGKTVSDVRQLWALPADGGEAVRWTDIPGGVEDYQWDSKGRFLLCLSSEPTPDSVRAREERKRRLKFDAVVKDSGEVRKVLWRVMYPDLNVEQVAVLDPGVRSFAISPDGQWMVYETNYTGKYDDEQKYDLWCVQLTTGEVFPLTRFPGPEYQPRFSPDGRWIFYINQTTPDIEFAEWDLARIPFRPRQTVQKADTLTHDLDRSVQTFEFDARGRLYIQVAEGTETHLYRFDWNKQKKRYSRITPVPGAFTNFFDLRFTDTGQAFCLAEGPYRLPEIIQLRSRRVVPVTRFSDRLKEFTLGQQRVYRYTSVDGVLIEALVIFPVNYQPDRQYPLILTIHGGPYGRFRHTFRQAYFHQVYANNGFLLLAPNPRGSSGYDDAFGKAIWYRAGGHMGGVDYQDIMAGVDAVIAEGWVDSTRMGVIGGSYGGYMTNWIIAHTHRFAAAVSLFGIFSLFTDWSNSWQPSWEKMYLGIYYWEQPISPEHPYVKYSPAFYVQNIQTPVLIMHGEKDRYTNLANSQEMYQALKTLQRPVKFVVYPREGHGLGREPNHRRDVFHRALKWFQTYLKPDVPASRSGSHSPWQQE
ncbi:MAG: S9 family peptidase [Calditrichaeota bacterium]|nr:S9 family peptidase [Calditrichota bacterium]